jgi:CHAD domain-containing protein
MTQTGKWIEGIAADADVAEAARISLGERLTAVAYWLPAAAYAADEDLEHVHRLRVSTRRAMAAWRLFRNWLPRKRARRVKKWLKEIREAAGEARDLDVMAERMKRQLGESGQDVLDEIARRRTQVQPAIVRVADRARRRGRFARDVGKLLSGIQSCCNKKNCDECAPFNTWGQARLAELARDFFDDLPAAEPEMSALHQFRIRAKALRYSLELVAPSLGLALRHELYPIVEELQDRLGQINDRSTAAQRLKEWSEEASDAAAGRAQFAALADNELRKLEDQLREFRDWWSPERVEALRAGLIPEARKVGRTVLL